MTVAASAQRAAQVRPSAPPAEDRSAVSPRALAELLRDQRVVDALTGPGALPDRAEFKFAGRRSVTIAAVAQPANGRPASAALRIEAARGPFDSQGVDAPGLSRMLRGRRVERVVVTGHPRTTDAYHVLMVLDSGEQVGVEAHSIPADAGCPALRFGVQGFATPPALPEMFGDAGELPS